MFSDLKPATSETPDEAKTVSTSLANAHKSSLSDIPLNSNQDDFEIKHHVDGLVEFIKDSETPITIALQGEWGSGKTSLINRLQNRLCGKDGPFESLVINTWEFSMLSSPEVTIHKILERLVNALIVPSLKEKVEKSFVKFTRATVKAGLGVFTRETDVVDNVFEAFGTKRPSELEELRKTLEESIETRTRETGKKAVLVFIDDLDRLNPPVAVEILELLKNLFNLKNCIFILAIDYDVVVKGLKPKFGELTSSNEREFRSFFDKIIQVPFSLPVNSYKPMNFVLKALGDVGFINEEDKNTVQEDFKKIVSSSVGKNPRSIKRLINTLSLINRIRKAQEAEKSEGKETSLEEKTVLFGIVAIQVCYPKVYRMLCLNPDFTSWDEELAAKCSIKIDPDDDSYDSDDPMVWETVLSSLCKQDTYLNPHRRDIERLLALLKEKATRIIKEEQQPEENTSSLPYAKVISRCLGSSSVTGVDTTSTEDLSDDDQTDLIFFLHDQVKKEVAEIDDRIELQNKRNTGNGGFWMKIVRTVVPVIFKTDFSGKEKKLVVVLPTAQLDRLGLSATKVRELKDRPCRGKEFKELMGSFNEFLNKYDWLLLLNTKGEEITPDKLQDYQRETLVDNILHKNTMFEIKFKRVADLKQEIVVKTIAQLMITTRKFLLAIKASA